MNLILIGYRATGKTTLARLLAERLGWTAADVDAEIQRRAGKTIAQIFADDGEPAFRDLESAVVCDLCRGTRQVLATGGGTCMRPENQRAMRAGGRVVWLRAKPETIHARMNADIHTAATRPSLTDRDPLAEILHLLEKREPVYRELAQLSLDTEEHTPEQLADAIQAWLAEQPENRP